MKERKAFQHLPASENPQFKQDGIFIYDEMRKKHPDDTIESLDNILNGICASLVIVSRIHVNPFSHKEFLQVIWSILNKNL